MILPWVLPALRLQALYSEIAASGAAGLTVGNLLVAIGGAIVLVAAYHLLLRPREPRYIGPERRQRGLLRNQP